MADQSDGRAERRRIAGTKRREAVHDGPREAGQQSGRERPPSSAEAAGHRPAIDRAANEGPAGRKALRNRGRGRERVGGGLRRGQDEAQIERHQTIPVQGVPSLRVVRGVPGTVPLRRRGLLSEHQERERAGGTSGPVRHSCERRLRPHRQRTGLRTPSLLLAVSAATNFRLRRRP